ncbi:MAG: hypothetical protein KDC60_08225, partial [Bacteroidetes bacterium]|nr:hypothetical protein [Bacteroidota bacterium]
MFELQSLGPAIAEDEVQQTYPLQYLYVNNSYKTKFESFNPENKEVFLIGRTGCGKSALLEMVRQKAKKKDNSRVVSIGHQSAKIEHDLTFSLPDLLDLSSVNSVPSQLRPLVFKSLWKYLIMINILRRIYDNDIKKFFRILEQNETVYRFLEKYGGLNEQLTIVDQVFSFLDELDRSLLGGFSNKSDIEKRKYAKYIYDLYLELEKIENTEFSQEIKGKFIYMLFDDLDYRWAPDQRNKDLIRYLFETINLMNRKFSGRIRFIVALRTDIFRQLEFHQVEKIKPYVLEMRWDWQFILEIIKKRMSIIWNVRHLDPLQKFFPPEINGVPLSKYLTRRTLRRPRDIINFVNKIVEESSNFKRYGNQIPVFMIENAEKRYSRERMDALCDEWKFVYPNVRKWINRFAG